MNSKPYFDVYFSCWPTPSEDDVYSSLLAQEVLKVLASAGFEVFAAHLVPWVIDRREETASWQLLVLEKSSVLLVYAGKECLWTGIEIAFAYFLGMPIVIFQETNGQRLDARLDNIITSVINYNNTRALKEPLLFVVNEVT